MYFLYSLGGVTFNKCWITLSILNCYSPNFQGFILMKNALNNQVGMLGNMFLWLVANLKQGVIYFIKQEGGNHKIAWVYDNFQSWSHHSIIYLSQPSRCVASNLNSASAEATAMQAHDELNDLTSNRVARSRNATLRVACEYWYLTR